MQTDRDARIVHWLGLMGAAGALHVSEQFGVHIRIVHKRLRLLVADDLVELNMILYRRPGLYCATRRGLRWQGLGRLGVYRVSPGGYEHDWQVATAAVGLKRELPDWRQLGEREIKALEIEDRRLLASVHIGGIGSKALLHRPDLALISPSGSVVSVEVERSIKSPSVLGRICQGWARARHVDHVYYLATPEAARAVNRALERVKATDRVTVLDLEDVAGLAAHTLAREEARDERPV
jgi:hypothetical protein